MSQTPITVTYSLEEILGQINQKLDVLQKDVTDIKIGQIKFISQIKFEAELTGRIDKLESKVTTEKRIQAPKFIYGEEKK